MLAHDLANKLAAIVANCDMLRVQLIRAEKQLGSKPRERLEKVMELAYIMGDMLASRECELSKAMASVEPDDRQSQLLSS
jgi:hypothetical protein